VSKGTIVWDIQGQRRVVNALRNEAIEVTGRVTRRLGVEARASAKRVATATPRGPDATDANGNLLPHAQDRWRAVRIGPGHYEVQNDTPQVGFLLTGTPDHGPTTAKAMHWMAAGQPMFATFVHGIEVNQGLKGALDGEPEVISRSFGSWLGEEATRLHGALSGSGGTP